jgi:N-acetyl-anhydromuramyl-L-alanine amidase AmpD
LTINVFISWRFLRASFAMLLFSHLAFATCAFAAERMAAPAISTAKRQPSSVRHDVVLAKRLQPAVTSRAWKSIVLHHSATDGGDVETIDAEHRKRKDAAGNAWLGIGYHFVIGNGHGLADGIVEPTFRWRKQLAGAHAGTNRQNESSIGICLIGNFNDAEPTPRQLAAVQELVAALASRYRLDRTAVVRHLDVRATECPGRNFPFDQVVAPLPAGNSAANN